MALLYNVKIKTLDLEDKSIVVNIDSIHPDAMYFSNNLAFAIRLIHDAAIGTSPIAKSIDLGSLSNEQWMKQKVKGYISSCELIEVRTPGIAEIKNDGKDSYWYGETDQASATIVIHFTDQIWMQHLSANSNWKSTAYPMEGDFMECAPIGLPSENDSSFSDNYAASGGWITVKSEILDDYNTSWPMLVYIPKYTEKSYRRVNKSAQKDLTQSIMNELLFKTVFVLTKAGFKCFGILVPIDDTYRVVTLSTGGCSFAGFGLSDILTIGTSEFNIDDDTKVIKCDR